MTATDNNNNVIVSLTSFPGAIHYATGAIKSVLAGSVMPRKVVLYVTLSQFGEAGLPRELLELERDNNLFEIRNYDHDIRSYRKLVPALADFPDAIIVTIDDDVAYHPDMLRVLLQYHKIFPHDILAHRAKHISIGRPYRKWKKYRWYHFLNHRIYRKYSNIQTGVGGVLYPPQALKTEMIDESLFTRLAPTADDIWFWAAAVANGRKIIPIPYGYNKPRGLGKPRELSLKTINFKSGVDRNTASFEAILDAYPIIRERIENEQ